MALLAMTVTLMVALQYIVALITTLTIHSVVNIEIIYNIAIYHSPKVSITQLCRALREVLMQQSPFDIVVGDFNVSWLNESQRVSLYNLFVRDNNYRQLVIHFTTASQ